MKNNANNQEKIKIMNNSEANHRFKKPNIQNIMSLETLNQQHTINLKRQSMEVHIWKTKLKNSTSKK